MDTKLGCLYSPPACHDIFPFYVYLLWVTNLCVDLCLKLYCTYIQYTTLPPHVVVLCVKYICCYLLLGTWGIFLASTTSRSGARSQMLLIDAVSLCKHAAAAYKPRVQIKFEMKNSSASSIKANCQC